MTGLSVSRLAGAVHKLVVNKLEAVHKLVGVAVRKLVGAAVHKLVGAAVRKLVAAAAHTLVAAAVHKLVGVAVDRLVVGKRLLVPIEVFEVCPHPS